MKTLNETVLKVVNALKNDGGRRKIDVKWYDRGKPSAGSRARPSGGASKMCCRDALGDAVQDIVKKVSGGKSGHGAVIVITAQALKAVVICTDRMTRRAQAPAGRGRDGDDTENLVEGFVHGRIDSTVFCRRARRLSVHARTALVRAVTQRLYEMAVVGEREAEQYQLSAAARVCDTLACGRDGVSDYFDLLHYSDGLSGSGND